jgi:hypothetical protein
MSFEEADQRRDAFIADLVEVCKKHRVMLEPDGSEWEDLDPIDIMFAEFNEDVNLTFYVGFDAVEAAIRTGVWPCIHPVGEFDRADELD